MQWWQNNKPLRTWKHPSTTQYNGNYIAVITLRWCSAQMLMNTSPSEPSISKKKNLWSPFEEQINFIQPLLVWCYCFCDEFLNSFFFYHVIDWCWKARHICSVSAPYCYTPLLCAIFSSTWHHFPNSIIRSPAHFLLYPALSPWRSCKLIWIILGERNK